VFTSDDSKVITIAIDKQIILWVIKVEDNGSFSVSDVAKLETKNFLDVVFSGNRFVSMG
jgi:hypothetical protein